MIVLDTHIWIWWDVPLLTQDTKILAYPGVKTF